MENIHSCNLDSSFFPQQWHFRNIKFQSELWCTLYHFASFWHLQITNLVQHRSERPHSIATERTLRAIGRVGQAVNLAVERFVTVGETIADDNPDIKQDMYDACKEARAAGEWICSVPIDVCVCMYIKLINIFAPMCIRPTSDNIFFRCHNRKTMWYYVKWNASRNISCTKRSTWR